MKVCEKQIIEYLKLLLKISYGKNVYGKEIRSVIQQLNKSTQMGSSVKVEEKVQVIF